ncbi:uncharacterized protein LOC133299715 [Gastrolobium bilobum]|uniref:uncharacterized protein LOC133299715 n=1 Tax=Gastrolobium bilobum TaxID=150636 RepID=UPI002AB16D9B|nr:uncharacterized protein LOC133299715 [Gastrolobium bilobum]
MRSRICVKNLPKYVREDRLREFFSEKGEITDVKLIRTKEGKSRRFGFIGFRTEHEAQEAIDYFNGTCLDTQKITCEVAQKLGDPSLPQPWSRYSKQKDNKGTTPSNVNKHKMPRIIKTTRSRYVKEHSGAKGQGEDSKDVVDIDDQQLKDFLQVMEPRAKSKLWANDTSVVSSVGNHQAISNKDNKGTSAANHRVLHQSALEDGFPNNPEPNKSRDLEHDEVISDMDYFKRRVTEKWSDSGSSDDEDDNDNNDSVCIDDHGKDNHSHVNEDEENCDNKSSKRTGRNDAQQLDLEGQEDTSGEDVDHEKAQVNATEQGGQVSNSEDEKGVFEPCRLFVHNLPYMTTEAELEEHFSRYGSVSQVHLVVDKDTKRSKGIAYILFSLPEFASRALALEKKNPIFQGRLMHVKPAKQRPSNYDGNNVSKDQRTKTLKQRREEERKLTEASGDTKAWNSSFMRPDTVVEYIARKYGVSKSDLLDVEADDLAVRIALGETQVILERKKAFTNAGVNVESLEELANGKVDGLKRSNHVILVKNLHYGSTKNELAKKFGKFGNLDKINLPPTKTLALVVFLEPANAQAAFKHLRYTRYKDAPLYLEWAHSNVLSPSATSKNNEMNSPIDENDAKRLIFEQHVEKISDVDIDPDRVEAQSLRVKNLNFKTSDERLGKHFTEHIKEGRILSFKVQKHLKNGEKVSSGYGFVEFDSTETTKNVCRDLQGTVLDGHALILQLCHVKNGGQVRKTVEKDKSSIKLLVRNVAFEATKKDLRQFFSLYGQIKSLRLPKKFGSHRGFAFVEYVTQQEAQNALEAHSRTHLYGRRLVIERAKESDSLEELRTRTAAQYNEQNGFQNSTKLSKKRKHMGNFDEEKVKFQRIAD